MCVAVPGEVLELAEHRGARFAKVRFGRVTREVCLECVPEAVPGDFVLVHTGVALARINAADAARALAALEEIGEAPARGPPPPTREGAVMESCAPMTEPYYKQALKEELLRVLRADLSQGERAHESARQGATDEEAKPENDKDTRALEQSYLARGQAQRVDELRAAVAEVSAMPLRAFVEGQPAALGALVTADEDGATRMLFLAPHGGGAALGGAHVQVVTPKSPLGRALLGRQVGDECVVQVGGRVRAMTLIAIE